jgi:hypothetical protein
MSDENKKHVKIFIGNQEKDVIPNLKIHNMAHLAKTNSIQQSIMDNISSNRKKEKEGLN